MLRRFMSAVRTIIPSILVSADNVPGYGSPTRQAVYPIFSMPYNRDPNFIGREDVIDQIDVMFILRRRQRVAISGMAGVGYVLSSPKEPWIYELWLFKFRTKSVLIDRLVNQEISNRNRILLQGQRQTTTKKRVLGPCRQQRKLRRGIQGPRRTLGRARVG